jgi:osmotically-inducible protein OsmY
MRITSILVVSVLALAAGCSSPYGAYNTSPSYNSAALTQSEMDRALEASVRSQIDRYGDLRTAASKVQVLAQNGTVTLAGTVPDDQERQMMEVVARNTAGVVGVNDQLQVAYPPTGTYASPPQVYSPPPAPIITPPPVPVYSVGRNISVQATTEADRALAAGISERLRPDATITSLSPGVTVTVAGGRAYVRGTVASEEQRQTIISALRNTPGVVAVYDELSLR